MGFRFRKTFRIAKGLRLNLSRRGISVGMSIPGTGISINSGHIGSGGRARQPGDIQSGCLGCVGCLGIILIGFILVGLAVNHTHPTSTNSAQTPAQPQQRPPQQPTPQPQPGPLPVNNPQSEEIAKIENASESVAESSVSGQSKSSVPMANYVVAAKRKPDEPGYIRAIIDPGTLTQSEIEQVARNIVASANLDTDTTTVDFFDNAGSLTWSGTFGLSRGARDHWMCRVTIQKESAESKFDLAIDPRTNKPKKGVLKSAPTE